MLTFEEWERETGRGRRNGRLKERRMSRYEKVEEETFDFDPLWMMVLLSILLHGLIDCCGRNQD